jgi:hypothetical protein
VQLAGTVEAETDVEIFPGEKLAPLLINGRPVGLNAVDDLLAWGDVLLLEFDGFAKKIHSQQCGLAAVP